MVYKILKTQQLHCDATTAWAFFSSPLNLSKITPPDVAFVVLSNSLETNIYEGMIINYTVSPFLGIRLKWQTIIMEVVDKKRFCDFQKNGPYKYWNHCHEFSPNPEGILMTDTIHYEMPYGVAGRVVHELFVKKKLESIFDYRFQAIERLFNQRN